MSDGLLGGSGGGGAGQNVTVTSGGVTTYKGDIDGGLGTAGQGYAGGAGYRETASNNVLAGGGGGGAGGAGGTAAQAVAGKGGAGVVSDITGAQVTYAGGGGGGARAAGSSGEGGAGGGGAGGVNSSSNAADGQANTGGGGGGAGGNTDPTTGAGGNGGSGVVYVRFDTKANEALVLDWLEGITGDTGLSLTQLAKYLNLIEAAWRDSNYDTNWWTSDNLSDALAGWPVTVGAQSATLVEAGGLNNATTGHAQATIQLSWADTGRQVSSPEADMQALGWQLANGVYTQADDYGTVTYNPDTHQVSYALDDSLARVNALKADETKTTAFTVVLTDTEGNIVRKSVSFTILGSNDELTVSQPDLPEELQEDNANQANSTAVIEVNDLDGVVSLDPVGLHNTGWLQGDNDSWTQVSEYGTATLSRVGNTNNYTVNFALNNASEAVQRLGGSGNSGFTEQFTVSFTSSTGEAQTEVVSFLINGQSEPLVVTTTAESPTLTFTETAGSHQSTNVVSLGSLGYQVAGDEAIKALQVTINHQSGDFLNVGTFNLLSLTSGANNTFTFGGSTYWVSRGEGNAPATFTIKGDGASPTLSAVQIQSILNGLTFTNTSDTISTADRTIGIQYTDEGFNAKVLPSVTISVTGADDPISGQAALSSNTPGVGTALTVNTASVVDPDGTLTWGYEWSVSDGQGGWTEVSAWANQASITPTVAQSGKQIRVVATATDPVYGSKQAFTLTTTDAVQNNPPMVNVGSTTPTFAEDQAGTVTLSAGLTITEPNGLNLTSATISLGSSAKLGDKLSHGALPTGVSLDAASNDTTLIFKGSASVTAYQTLLRTIAFNTTSEDGSARSISWQVTNANQVQGSVSQPLTYTVSDDPMVATIGNASGDIVEDSSLASEQVVTRDLTLSDPDNTVMYDTQAMTTSGWEVVSGGFTKAGTYGTLMLNTSTGKVTFTANYTLNAYKALRTGQTAEEAFTITVANNAPTPERKVINSSFTVKGVDDPLTVTSTAASPLTLSFTEMQGQDDGSAKVLFSSLGLSVSGDEVFKDLNIRFNEQTSDRLWLGDANLLALPSDTGNVTVDGQNYNVNLVRSGGTTTVAFAPSVSLSTLSVNEIQRILNALSFDNGSDQPATVDRSFTVDAQNTDTPVVVFDIAAITLKVIETNDDFMGAPTLKGTASVSDVLTVETTGLTDLDTTQLQWAYQWQTSSDGQSWSTIQGATTASLTLTSAYTGQQVRVLATVSDPTHPSAPSKTFTLQPAAAVANVGSTISFASSTFAVAESNSGDEHSIVLGTGLSLTETRSGVNITQVVVELTSSTGKAGDALSLGATNLQGLSSSISNDGRTLTLSGTASASIYQDVLRTLSFKTTSETGGLRTLKISVTNSNGATSNANAGITVTSVDDPIIIAAGEATGAIVEDGSESAEETVSLTVTASDADTAGTTIDVQGMKDHGWTATSDDPDTAIFTKQGTYGTLKMSPDGTVTLTADYSLPAYQALKSGDTAYESFTVHYTNGVSTQSQELSFEVQGLDDDTQLAFTTNTLAFTEVSGQDDGSAAVSFAGLGASLVGDTAINEATLSFNAKTGDQLLFGGANLLAQASTTVVINNVTYTINRTENPVNKNATLTFIHNLGNTLSNAAVMAWFNGLSFNNPSDAVSNIARNFTLITSYDNIDFKTEVNTGTFTLTVTNVDEPLTGQPTVSQQAHPDEDVTVDISSVTDPDGTLTWTFVWEVSDSKDASAVWTVIEGATSSSYTPGAELLGQYLRVRATATDNNAGHTSSDSFTLLVPNPVNSDQPPVLTFDSTDPVTFTEDGAAVAATQGLSITDAHYDELLEASVSIMAGRQTGDRLIHPQAGETVDGIQIIVAADGYSIQFKGQASLAAYEALLEAVTFQSTSEIGGDRTLNWIVVNEQDLAAEALSTTVTVVSVDDPTTVSTTTGSNLVEDGTTTSTSVTITIVDPDSVATFNVDAMVYGETQWTYANGVFTKAGTYGDVVLNATTGVATYTLDNTRAATQALAQGQQVSELFSYITKADNSTQALSSWLVFNVLGTNDAPVVTSPQKWAEALPYHGYIDVSLSQFLSEMGVKDVDVGDTLPTLKIKDLATGVTIYAVSNQEWTPITPDANGVIAVATNRYIRIGYTGESQANFVPFSYTVVDDKGAESGEQDFVVDVSSQYPNLDNLFSFLTDADDRTDGGTEDFVLVNGEVMRLNAFTSTTTAYNFTAEAGTYNYLVVGGGGGGAGGLLQGTMTTTEATDTAVRVGAGGAGGTSISSDGTGGFNSKGEKGIDSQISGWGLTAQGGGGGGNGSKTYIQGRDGLSGGSGGGGGGAEITTDGGIGDGGAGTTNQGNAGGNSSPFGASNTGGTNSSQMLSAGGGGGAGEAGESGRVIFSGSVAVTGQAGNGGDGLESNITGENLFYAGGGGGARKTALAGLGGEGGGGNGGQSGNATDGSQDVEATDGLANTGGGGGGGSGTSNQGQATTGAGGDGGSGVVYVSFDTGVDEADLLDWLQDLVGEDATLSSSGLATYLNRIETAWEGATDPSTWWSADNVKSAILAA